MAISQYSKVITAGPRTRVEFLLIGSRILGISIFGLITPEYLVRLKVEREAFLKEVGLEDTYFIEFRDYSGIHNFFRTSFKSLGKEILNNADSNNASFNPLAIYYINLPPHARIYHRIILHQQQLPFIFEYCVDLNQVFERSLNLLYERGVYSFAEKSRVAGREWFYENSQYRESMQMLTDELIYAECRGALNRFDESKRRSSWEELLESQPSVRKGFILILGLKDYDFSQEDLECIFSSLWLELLSQSKCQKIIIITGQDSTAVSVSQLLTLTPVSHKVERRFYHVIQSLFPKISRRRIRKPSEFQDSQKRDLEKLENYLLSLDIKKSRKNQLISSESLRENDTLRPIYQAINVFFSEVRDDYLYINQDWKRLNSQIKIAQIMQGVFQMLYKTRLYTLDWSQALEELTDVINEVLEYGRCNCFIPSGGAYRCSRSIERARPSLLGAIIPSSVVISLEGRSDDVINENSWTHLFNSRERLLIGPFLQSFLRSQTISLFYYRIFKQVGTGERKMLVIDFMEENSPEIEIIEPLLQQISDLLEKHFTKSDAVPSRSAVELEEALGEYDGDEEFYTEILGVFIKGLEDQWEIMAQAIGNKDWDTLRKESHKIKGGSANLYAKELQEASRKLEQLATEGVESAIPKSFDKVKESALKLKDWYEKQW